MIEGRPPRRSLARAINRAIDGGRHMIDIRPDGAVRILPIDADSVQADGSALDADIRELMGHGDGRP